VPGYATEVFWTFDMIKELGVWPHNRRFLPGVLRRPVFAGTSNGRDETTRACPRRKSALYDCGG